MYIISLLGRTANPLNLDMQSMWSLRDLQNIMMHTLSRQLDIMVRNSSEKPGCKTGLESSACIVTEAIGVGAFKKKFWGKQKDVRAAR